MSENETARVWLAADYHFPSTYSCRSPMSSMSSARILPTPGPGTVQGALMRTGIEEFGIERTRDELFPIIRSAAITIRPPERVAISAQNLRAYKASADNRQPDAHLEESIIYREFAHAADPMTIYLQIPPKHQEAMRCLLMAVGYWGQANSFAQCTGVECVSPILRECAMPLRTFHGQEPVRHLITGLVTEFRDSEVTWDEIVTGINPKGIPALRHEIYIWPMKMIEQQGGDRLLLRCSISD